MAEIASAYVSLLPSFRGDASRISKELSPALAKAGRDGGDQLAGGMKSRIGGLAKGVVAPLGAAFAAVSVGDFFKSSIGEARESQKVGALTTQVIKSTGGAANVTAAQVGNLATAISNKVGIDDEAIQSGENMLLTFRNVRNEVGSGNDIFNQATQTITDMSAALGQDMKSSAIQLGKALNDPVKGVTALQRVGVSFTQQQRDQINTLVAGGKTMQAQKLILGELNKEFGGAAAAQATSGEKMKVAFDNLKESIGLALLPILDGLENFLTTKLIPAFSATVGFLSSHITAFKVIAAVISGVLVPALVVWGVQSTVNAAKSVAGWVVTQASAARSAAAQVVAVGRIVAGWVLMGVQSLLGAAKVAAAWLIALGPVALVVAAVAGVVVLVIKYWDKIKDATLAAWNFIKKHLKVILEAILVAVTGPIGLLVLFLAKHWDQIKDAVRNAWSAIRSAISTAVSAIVTFVKAMPDRILGALASLGSRLLHLAVSAWRSFASGVRTEAGNIVSFVRGIPSKIVSAIGDLGSLLYHAGTQVISGLARGIADAAKSTLTSVLHHVTDLIPIHKGPAATDRVLLYGNGQLIMQGLIRGIESQVDPLKRALGGVTAAMPTMTIPSIPSLSAAALSAATAGLGAPTVIVNNPVPEPASVSVPRALREAAFLHGAAW